VVNACVEISVGISGRGVGRAAVRPGQWPRPTRVREEDNEDLLEKHDGLSCSGAKDYA